MKKSAEIEQLHGRLAELRHQLDGAHRRVEAEAARRDEDVAAANAKAGRLKAENDELAVRSDVCSEREGLFRLADTFACFEHICTTCVHACVLRGFSARPPSPDVAAWLPSRARDVQAEVQRVQRALDAAPPAASSEKLHELQGALKQAVNDYELLLHELGHVRADVRRKDEAIAELRARLQDAGAATEQRRYVLLACGGCLCVRGSSMTWREVGVRGGAHKGDSALCKEQQLLRRHENEELEKLLTELEARMRPGQPASPPAAGLPSNWPREASGDGAPMRAAQPAAEQTIGAHRHTSMERTPTLEREARPTLGSGSPGDTWSVGPKTRERMRMIPPTGFC